MIQPYLHWLVWGSVSIEWVKSNLFGHEKQAAATWRFK